MLNQFYAGVYVSERVNRPNIEISELNECTECLATYFDSVKNHRK